MEGVTGSIPVPPTINTSAYSDFPSGADEPGGLIVGLFRWAARTERAECKLTCSP
jgi:hypothetical protein